MAEKKKQDDDTRDVFEKALDYAPAIIGAALGNVLLRGQSKRAAKAYRDYEASEAGRRMRKDTSPFGKSPDPLYAGNRKLRNAAADAASNRLTATIVGGGAGALAGDHLKRRARRK